MTMPHQIEREGAVTFKRTPMTLIGPELKVGDKTPDFQLVDADLNTLGWDDLSANGSRVVMMIVVPSIDTSICSLETSKFNRRVATLPADKIKAYAISADTPFAQKRWAIKEQIDNIQLLSDHKDRNFGYAYGLLMKELGLLARSIFIVDKDRTIRYIQTVQEVATEPDYDEVIREARQLTS